MTDITAAIELVPVFTGTINGQQVQVCDARALHTYLESKQQFADWIKNRIEKYGFEENQDFVLHKFMKQLPSGTKQVIDYHLTINMAKELGMVENNEKGRIIRRYFIDMEKKALESANSTVPNHINVLAAAQAWANMTQVQADIAQAQADKARLWADEYERNIGVVMPSLPSKPATKTTSLSPLTPREQAFIHAWWECFGTQTVTVSDLYRAIATKQCQVLNDRSGALLGDITQWSPKKLSHALRRWSQISISGYLIENIGKSSHGLLWRLEQSTQISP